MIDSDDFDDGWEAYECGDNAVALALLKPLAEQGDAAAQNLVGLIHEAGQGSQDDAETLLVGVAEIMDLAKTHNTPSGIPGKGAPRNYAEALKWYRKTAEQGLAKGQLNLGSMYEEGKGVAQDYTEALTWYRRAAEQGLAEAQCNLGMMYYYGLGVPQERIYSYMWFEIGATFGSDRAKSSRDLMTNMTPDEIIAAKRMARKWLEEHQQ